MNDKLSNDGSKPWLSKTVVGIVAAVFLSDFSHEMATAVLPLYLGAIGLGAGALGVIEGIGDLLVSLSKLAGGLLGHKVQRKKPWIVIAYIITSTATSCMSLARGVVELAGLRAVAWICRGFRSPLRDYMLADAVEPSHYGRIYGLERTGDMLGAVSGPLVATILIAYGYDVKLVLLVTLIPGLMAAGSIAFLARERIVEPKEVGPQSEVVEEIPKDFWRFLGGVSLFGLGDFSRSFLIFLAAQALGESSAGAVGKISWAVGLYALHNLISAAVAYPIGALGDRVSKLKLLIFGYALGVITNVWLAFNSHSISGVVVAVILSAIYLAFEETLEKASAAKYLPRSRRSLGLGYLAGANAFGDMASSLAVGFLLEAGRPGWAFGSAAFVGALGVLWMIRLAWGRSNP